MTMAQLAALIDGENALNAPAKATPQRGSASDLFALASMAGR